MKAANKLPSFTENQVFALSEADLYCHIDSQNLPFKLLDGKVSDWQMLGHQTAKEALTYVISCSGPGQNAYVRGLPGTGRKTLIRQIFADVKPQTRRHQDYCYVHNFSQVNSPRLLILEAGKGKKLKQMMLSFANYILNELPKTLNSDEVRQNRRKTEEATNQAVAKIYEPFEKTLKASNLALANIKDNGQTRMIIAPLFDGKIITHEEFLKLRESGKITVEDQKKLEEKLVHFQDELQKISQQANDIIEDSLENLRTLDNTFVKKQLSLHINTISKSFANKYLDEYLSDLVDDFIENKLHNPNPNFDPIALYGVNVINKPRKNKQAPVVFESSPSLANLIGTLEPDPAVPAYASISSGSLLKADGGFLVVEVDDALADSESWFTIINTLNSGYLHMTAWNFDEGRYVAIKPEPIPIDIQVILIGSYRRFNELSHYVSEFSEQFKILVDLDTELDNDNTGHSQYIQALQKTIESEKLLPFDASAVARIIEYGARINSNQQKLTAQTSKISDIAREASYLARHRKQKKVIDKSVEQAIYSERQRNALPARHFFQLLGKGILNVCTSGDAVGQINGLAVSGSVNFSYGFPARITATVSPGRAGLINIEGQANLSGQIHTKGFQILGGLLRYLIKPEHPLSFSASIAFEQSYGGIDGDSASGAEACCLLSAIANYPIRQSLAMTGAIDQFGHLQAIGGVNEKIEGFFDCCVQAGLNGEQGVIIPLANRGDLMLKAELRQAQADGLFHVFAVDHVLDALAILTHTPSEKANFLGGKDFAIDGLLNKVMNKIKELYEHSK